MGSVKQQQEVEHALHSLQRQQVQVQQELAVGRARERLWRESASTNERLLEKVRACGLLLSAVAAHQGAHAVLACSLMCV